MQWTWCGFRCDQSGRWPRKRGRNKSSPRKAMLLQWACPYIWILIRCRNAKIDAEKLVGDFWVENQGDVRIIWNSSSKNHAEMERGMRKWKGGVGIVLTAAFKRCLQYLLSYLYSSHCAFFTAEIHRVHAEFHGVFLGAPVVRRVHGGRLCWSLGPYLLSSPIIRGLILSKIFLEP